MNPTCPLDSTADMLHFEPQAEDILTDEDLLELFRIIKQIIKKRPDVERLAKLYFCISYAMGEVNQFYRPNHSNHVVYRDDINQTTAVVRVPFACCNKKRTDSNIVEEDSSQRVLSVSYLTNPSPPQQQQQQQRHQDGETDQYSVRPYTHIKPLYPTSSPSPSIAPNLNTHHHHIQPQSHHLGTTNITPSPSSIAHALIASGSSNGGVNNSHHNSNSNNNNNNHNMNHLQNNNSMIGNNSHRSITPSPITSAVADATSSRYPNLNTTTMSSRLEVLMEPKQRGFYYQDNRINREPALLQRYAEQGVLTQASLMRKRKRQLDDSEYPYELSTLPAIGKRTKIPHRHGEFKQRRDDIISRMRSMMMTDLEQKTQRLTDDFSLAIEKTKLPENIDTTQLTSEQAKQLLAPALGILTFHSNMKPHLDNGMNQNGIYYNDDYFRLYQAFVQFQKIFAQLFPNEVMPVTDVIEEGGMPSPPGSSIVPDKDRERNANMKAYRAWVEPLLTESNWAAFRRNVMVGERIMQLSNVVGQGILLMTKELSGSKLHLTFTNNEWEEFIQGLSQGKWDETIDWSHEESIETNQIIEGSLLVHELRLKFATHFWFTEQGKAVPLVERKAARAREKQNALAQNNSQHDNTNIASTSGSNGT